MHAKTHHYNECNDEGQYEVATREIKNYKITLHLDTVASPPAG